MARKPDIEYIRFYTDGSEARQLAPKKQTKPLPQPKPHRERVTAVRIAPLTVCAIVLACVMLVLLIAGAARLAAIQDAQAEMAVYVGQLRTRNELLSAEYAASYDLESVEQAALAMGMIPAAEGAQRTVRVVVPAISEEPTLWERITAFFSGLFA